ncbi:MAG: hypothetical protein KBD01_09535 [Acidobacteria bacterium]|nr:hypothetical protein [Acidobacteriota bacterium]
MAATPVRAAAPPDLEGADEAATQVRADTTVFFAALEPYGNWSTDPRYGPVWHPRDELYRPYTRGRWAFTAWGLTFLSEDVWGWAVHHYGRWYYDAALGWTWVPGAEWAPAWVAWRADEEHVGWAPLPPEATWPDPEDMAGFGFGEIPPDLWSFVRKQDLLLPILAPRILPSSRNEIVAMRTRDITRYGVLQERVANLAWDQRELAIALGRPVLRYDVVDLAGPPDPELRVHRREIGMFRPLLTQTPRQQALESLAERSGSAAPAGLSPLPPPPPWSDPSARVPPPQREAPLADQPPRTKRAPLSPPVS